MLSNNIYIYLMTDSIALPCGLLRCFYEDQKVIYSTFRYGLRYLDHPRAISIDLLKLPLSTQEFRTESEFDIFQGLKDSSPDSWGRAVMERRADRLMREDEFLMASTDHRVGALSFGRDLNGPKRVTPWAAKLEESNPLSLEQISASFTDYHDKHPERFAEALRRYILPGSSLGGARPKASVNIDGKLWLAKFSLQNDSFDFVRAEFAAMSLARECGIWVPNMTVKQVGPRSVFLIERFDRQNNQRQHFNSALSLLGETELSFMHSSYMELAFALDKYSNQPQIDKEQLFRRMVFNGLCFNNDDHLRNHGMVYSEIGGRPGFRLSPAYDIVPNPVDSGPRRLAIGCGYTQTGEVTRRYEPISVLRTAADFGLTRDKASAIESEIRAKVLEKWALKFENAGIKGDELKPFTKIFGHI